MKKIFTVIFAIFLFTTAFSCSYQPTNANEEPVIYTLVDSHGIPRHFKETEDGNFEYVTSDGIPLSEGFGDNFDLTSKDWTKEDVDNWHKELEEMKRELKQSKCYGTR